MTTTLEKVGFAMFADTVGDGAESQWANLEEGQRQIYISNARAAIQALMGPSEDIQRHGAHEWCGDVDPWKGAGLTFDAMLQAILDEEKESA